MSKEAHSKKPSSFSSVVKNAALFALAMTGGSALPLAEAVSKDNEKESGPQSLKIPRDCKEQLAEVNQSIGVMAKVAEKLGTLNVSPDEGRRAVLARQSQNIHSCHDKMKMAHIANGDVTFISDKTIGNYEFDDSLEILPIKLSDSFGYAVYDPNKISDSDVKSIEVLKKGEMSIEKISLMLSAEVPDLHAALYVLNDNPDVAHKESLDILLKNIPGTSKEEGEALVNLAKESLPTVTRAKGGKYVTPSDKNNDEMWYSLKGNDRLSRTVSKLISSIEPEIIMPSKEEISEQLSAIPSSARRAVCEETTIQSFNDLSAKSSKLAEKYAPLYNNFFATCADKQILETNLKTFNGAGQAMTQAGSVYIPFKASKAAMSELRNIAKDEVSKSANESKESGYASKIEKERYEASRSVEL